MMMETLPCTCFKCGVSSSLPYEINQILPILRKDRVFYAVLADWFIFIGDGYESTYGQLFLCPDCGIDEKTVDETFETTLKRVIRK